MDYIPAGSSVHGIPQEEYWSGLLFLCPGDLPDPGIEPTSPLSPALAGRFFTSEPPGKAFTKTLNPNNGQQEYLPTFNPSKELGR